MYVPAILLFSKLQIFTIDLRWISCLAEICMLPSHDSTFTLPAIIDLGIGMSLKNTATATFVGKCYVIRSGK